MTVPATDLSVGGSANPLGTAPRALVRAGRARWRKFRYHLDLYVPASFLALLVLACFVWPEIYSLPNPVKGNLNAVNRAPFTAGHLFGTDPLGNDIFSRILYGGRVSLEVGFGSTALGLAVGGLLGAYCSMKGGRIEMAVMRCLEVFLAFPSLVLAIVVANFLGPSELHVIWAISFFSVPSFARLARAGTLKLNERDFITAARITGLGDLRLLSRHVVPNVLPSLVTYSLLSVGVSIIVEAALSFLGLGVPAPGASWGNMIALGQQNISTSPDLVIIPSAFLFATVLCLNFVGDALRARWATA